MKKWVKLFHAKVTKNIYLENARLAISFLYWAPGKSIPAAALVAIVAAFLRELLFAATSKTLPPAVTSESFAPLATPLWNTTTSLGMCDKPSKKKIKS